MFSTTFTRAAHRAATPKSPSSVCYTCLASARPTHQRRHSSRKVSWSPDNSTTKPAPDAKAAVAPTESDSKASSEQPVSVPAKPQQPRSSKGRTRGAYNKKVRVTDESKGLPAEPVDQYAALPRVDSTPVRSWSDSERSISNFFAQHRPNALTHTFPPPTSDETFHNIFSSHQEADPWVNGNSAEGRPEDVIYTLHGTFESLDSGASQAQDEGVRWEVINESSSNSEGVKHLDGAPRMPTLEEMVARFKPFRAPPPPQPFVEVLQDKPSEKKVAADGKKAAKSKHKTFTATITVTESTDSNGHRTYSASSSPIVRLPDAENAASASGPADVETTAVQRTRRERVRQQAAATQQQDPKSIAWNVYRIPTGLRGNRVRVMYAISVKRQRKLKMKKHKYKKLMKRTRNLRRRQERA